MGQAIPYVTGNTIPQSCVGGGRLDWPVGAAGALGLDNPNAWIRYRSTGTLSLLATRIVVNTTAAASTVTLYKNGSSAGVGVTIGAGLTGDFEDLTGAIPVASGDGFSYVILGGFPGGGLTLQGVRVVFTPDADTVSRLTLSGNSDMGDGTVYFPLWGCGVTGWRLVTEAETQVMVPTDGTGQNLLIRLDQNTTTGTTTVRLRKNNANTALVLTVGAGLTGVFEDLVNTESIAENDLLNYVVEGGGGGGKNLSVSTICMDFVSTSNLTIAGGSVSAAFNIGVGVSSPTAFQGRYDEASLEADTQLTPGVQTFLRGLGTLVILNSLNGTSHLRLRKNGMDGVSDVVIGAGLTGHFIDTIGEDELAATDQVNFAGTTEGSTGALIANTFYYALGASSEPPPPPPECPGLASGGARIDGLPYSPFVPPS